MIQDVYSRFKELYLETNGKILVQNFLLEKEPSICIKVDENGKVIEKLIVVDTVKKDELYDWFAIRNIKSSYLNNNKAVGSKMIFSANNYTLFGRIDTFPLVTYQSFIKLFDVKEDKNNKKTTAKFHFYQKYQKEIKTLFESILSPISLSNLIEKMNFISENEKLLIQNSFITDIALNAYYEKLVNSYSCTEKQFFTSDMLNNILVQIDKDIEEYAHKQIKLKIFRDVPIEKYQKSELNYLNSSLFAVEDKYFKIENNIFGQPYLDNTLNADKPFMLHQTMKSIVPFPKSKDEILYIKYLDDYLSMHKGVFYLELEKFTIENKPFKEEQFIIQKKKNYELFEFIPCFHNEFKDKKFVIRNHLMITKNRKIIDDKKPYKEVFLLEKDIDKLCNKKLIKNYFSESIKGIDKKLESYIFLIRDSCFLYFRKGQITGKEFYEQIKKIVSLLIIYQYNSCDAKQIKTRVSESLNLKLSMQEYYKGDSMDIKNELDSLNMKLNKDGYELLNHKEFLLLSGQMAYYLLSQSESNNRTFRLAEHYLKSKNIQIIKKHLRNDLEKYKHKIYLMTHKSKFKKALALCVAYEQAKKLTHDDMDIFLIGLVSDNIFYRSSEDKSINQSPAEE